MDKKFLITGASSDVGILLLQRLLAQDGTGEYAVQGFGDLAGLAPLAKQYPGRLHTFDVNLADPDSRELFLAQVEKRLGVPTHIVHLPALRVVNTKFKNFDADRFMLDMQVQPLAAAAVCQRFLPAMAKQRYGRVLFMLTSYVLGVPPKNTAAYVMAKEALRGLAKSLAIDYASFGVTVNCIAPSMMETKFLADTPSLIVQAAAESNPMGRNATPADVVPAMEFLLGDDAAFITGAVLPITGGSVF